MLTNQLLHALLTPPAGGGAPSSHQVSKVNLLIGKRVSIMHTSYKGTVLRLNKNTSGFYPGSDFPCVVQIDEDNSGVKNAIFEYGLEQVIPITE